MSPTIPKSKIDSFCPLRSLNRRSIDYVHFDRASYSISCCNPILKSSKAPAPPACCIPKIGTLILEKSPAVSEITYGEPLSWKRSLVVEKDSKVPEERPEEGRHLVQGNLLPCLGAVRAFVTADCDFNRRLHGQQTNQVEDLLDVQGTEIIGVVGILGGLTR
ncbi:hypothetical protein CRG98_035810 [Punica granatum]|uniref:Uncharacterized protein n=1 Tax=Punica granatum TaxID=22663 RepID=A0A2I0IIG0_PUNGR|nr:hypothetical protein CRG98_035810 [Punica granatum]